MGRSREGARQLTTGSATSSPPPLAGEGQGGGAKGPDATRFPPPQPSSRSRMFPTSASQYSGRTRVNPGSAASGGGSRPSTWRRSNSILTAILVLIAALSAAAYWIGALAPATRDLAFSTLVLDRDGKLLRPYTTPEGRWRLPASREDVDPRFVELLLAYEDKRFNSHPGVDPLALGRAFVQLVRSGRVVSGASTITMQVARLLEPHAERNVIAKLRQMALALALERALGKDEILALYLSLAPYGGNIEGVRAAALAYFGKEPRRLTLGEAALLVALPQSPEQRRPDRSTDAARKARDRVLERVATAGIVSGDEIARARREPGPEGRLPMPMLAPHAADAAVAAAPARNPSPHHRSPIAARSRRACPRARPQSRSRALRRCARRRQCDRRGAGARRLGRLSRSTPRRPGRYDHGTAVAGFDAQAVHLRAGLRGRARFIRRRCWRIVRSVSAVMRRRISISASRARSPRVAPCSCP